MTHRSYQSAAICAAVLQIALVAGCSKAGEPEQAAPPLYKVRLDTSKGLVEIQVHRDWAPVGADHFYQLVKAGYYDGARFFRVVPNFVVQFGLAADPAVTKKWDHAITDDPVRQTNRAGTLVYAAESTPILRIHRLHRLLDRNAQGRTPDPRNCSSTCRIMLASTRAALRPSAKY